MNKRTIISALAGLAGIVATAGNSLAAKPEDVQKAVGFVQAKGQYNAQEKCHVYDVDNELTVKFYPQYDALKVVEKDIVTQTVPESSTQRVLKPGWTNDVTGDQRSPNGVLHSNSSEAYDYITVHSQTVVNVAVERVATDHGLNGTVDAHSFGSLGRAQRAYDGAVSQLAAQPAAVSATAETTE